MTLPAPLDAVDAALQAHFAHRPLRASVSFVGVEQLEVLRFEPIPDERAYLSLGMSRAPMSSASSPVTAATGPRAELMLHLRDGADRFADVWRRIALLAAAPAVEGVVYQPGMTVDLGEPLVVGTSCTGGVITESPIAPISVGRAAGTGGAGEPEVVGGSGSVGQPGAPDPAAPRTEDAEIVAILQVIPATSTELAWCRVHGSAALRERWGEQEVDLLDLGRRPVQLA